MTENTKLQVLIIKITHPESDQEMALWEAMYPEFRKGLDTAFTTRTVADASTAIDVLSDKDNLPRAALVVTGEVFSPGHTADYFRLHQKLASFASDDGGAVVFCAMVPSFVRPNQLGFIFRKAYNLPWEMVGYTKNDQTPNPAMKPILGEQAFGQLSEDYPKAVFLSGIKRESMVFMAKKAEEEDEEGDLDDSEYSEDDDSDDEEDEDCMMAFHEYGKGRVGWIGDVNNHEGNAVVGIHAMIKFAIRYHESACLVCQRSPANTVCTKCKTAKYCCVECRRYDWTAHKPGCLQPKWKNPSQNKFEALFPGYGTDDGFRTQKDPNPGNDNFEQAIFRIIDAFRVWHDGNSTTPLIDRYSFENDLNDEVVEEFQSFLRKARAADAVPCWWDETCEERIMEYATWESEGGEHLIPGSMKSDLYIGKRVMKNHVAKQYGGNKTTWDNIKELSTLIGAAVEPKGDDEEFW